MRGIPLLIPLILALAACPEASASKQDMFCSASQPIDKQCGKYAYNILKPILSYLKLLQTKLDENKVDELIEENKQLKNKLIALNASIKAKDSLLDSYKNSNEMLNALISNKDQNIEYRNNVASLTNCNAQMQRLNQKQTKLISDWANNITNANIKSKTIENLNKLIKKHQSQSADDAEKFSKLQREKQNQGQLIEQLTHNLTESHTNNNSLKNNITTLQSQAAMDAKLQKELNQSNLIQSELINRLKRNLTEAFANTEKLNNTIILLHNQSAIDALKLKELQKEHNSALEKYQIELSELQAQLKKCAGEVKIKATPNSCKPFANQPGVHEIKVPGLEAFEVLCTDSSIAGPGWIIIQQRINGQQDFHQDWQAYRDGFGLNKTSGDFFLGLQKIHRLTYSQRYELFIYMQTFRGGTFHIRYDNFTVGSENDKFELQSLGAVDMANVEDQLRYHEHHKFTTHDQDNDNWWRNCATEIRSGGWWYHKSCTHCNLNGVYFKTETDAYQSLHWFDYKSLKMVQMLIRPIN